MSQIRSISARSALLTFLIGGADLGRGLTAAELVVAGTNLDIAESTVRAAISRMLTTGDLVRDGQSYLLSERLEQRRARQRERLAPHTRRWRGDWEVVVVTATGRSPADRAALRTALVDHRLAELREGVWLRPDNLPPWPQGDVTRRLVTRPVEDAQPLAAELFELEAWRLRGQVILDAVRTAEPPGNRFAACVAGVRHLLTDPVLPPELLPAAWPAAEIRAEYDESVRWMASLLT